MSRPEGDRTSVTSERFIEALNERIRRALRVGLTGQYLLIAGGEPLCLSQGGEPPATPLAERSQLARPMSNVATYASPFFVTLSAYFPPHSWKMPTAQVRL